jgi:hypothetical protein
MSGSSWAALGLYLASAVIAGCLFGLLIRAAKALLSRYLRIASPGWTRSTSQHTTDEWIRAAYPDADFHRQIMDAVYAEHDRMLDVPAADLAWVMSQEWQNEIREAAGTHVSVLNYAQHRRTVDAFIGHTMLGISVEIRDGAGFPKLVKREVK